MNREQKLVLLRIFSAGALLIAFAIWSPPVQLRLVFYLLPYLIIGYDILWEALRNITRGQIFDENFLMSLATVGAFFIGNYPEGVFVMLFYQVGEFFQSRAVEKSRASISDLMNLVPEFATLEQDGQTRQVDPAEVDIGQTILIRPGEKIPLDGVVIDGNSSVNTMALTGESLPRDVTVGSDIISGCVNLNGLLRVRVTKRFEDSTVSKILELVESSAANKAKTENFITRFARYYTPLVVLAAALIAVVPPLFLGDWSTWIYKALSFLVISCPCALVLSIPLSFFGGIGGASRRGILIKGSTYLEALAKAEIVAFDKTGTLTKGSFSVTAIAPENGWTAAQLLDLAAAAEQHSDHPIALSLRQARTGETTLPASEDVEVLPGLGLSALVDGIRVLAGNARLMEDHGLATPAVQGGGTVVHLAANNIYAGHILLSDQLKDSAVRTVLELKASGVRQTVMLTGDNEASARQMADTLAIDQLHAQLLPQEKVSCVESLLSELSPTGKLVFVGDGINDAPVLSRADVGVAMGAFGSDAAMEAADVVLMDDDPEKLLAAIQIARKTMRIAKQNIVFSLVVKVLVLLLTLVGLSNMWEAVLADVGVSFVAILNATRTLYFTPSLQKEAEHTHE